MSVYKASRKTTGKDGKTYWTPVGFTVFVGEYEGKPSVTLVDERTGEKYPCFAPKPRDQQPEATTDGAPF